MMNDEKSYEILRQNRTMKRLFLFLFGIVILFLLYIFRFYLWTFLFAVIFYVAIRPIHEILLGVVKRRSISSTIVILLLFFLIIIPSMFVLLSFSDQIFDLYKNIQFRMNHGFIDQLENNPFVEKVLSYVSIDKGEISNKFIELVRRTYFNILSSITSVISFPINFMTKFLLMGLMIFFLLKDGNKLDDAIYKILPFPDDMERTVINRLKEVIYVLMLGNLFIMCIQGFMVGLGFYIADVRTPLLWGTLAAVLSLIPVIGTTLIWGPVSLFLIFSGQYGWGVFIALWSFLWYLILENLLKPKVFGDKLNFHPVVFFFLLLGSIQAFSLPGVIIGPILLSLFYSFWEIYKILDEYDMDRRIKLENRDK